MRAFCRLLPLIAALVGTLALVAGADQPKPEEVPLEARFHRLSRGVRPTKYDIKLDLSHAFSAEAPAVYKGEVLINVEFHAPRRRTGFERGATKLFDRYIGKCVGKEPYQECPFDGYANEIVLHADESVAISSVEVFGENLKPMKLAKLGRDKAKQMIVLKMAKDLPRDGRKGLIKILFEAPIRADNKGVYFSTDSSRPGASERTNFRHVVAKFQPTFARLALPCFDEPDFKANFNLKIKHDKSKAAYANTEMTGSQPANDPQIVVSEFEETPPMSIHMVAFALGDFDPQPLTKQVRPDLTLRYLSVPGQAQKGSYALRVAEDAIDWFEKYIDRAFPLKKLDIVAVSDTDTDNTETWGLVFVRDFIVADDEERELSSRLAIAVNVAHVVFHQWFANLVTVSWWNDLWLTESVAAQKALEFVTELYPDFTYLLRLSPLSSILDLDASGETLPVAPNEEELITPEQIYAIFDNLHFYKGAALARMLQNMIQPKHMQATLRQLVKKFEYKTFNFADILSCIEDLSGTRDQLLRVDRMIESFATQTGFPLLNVDVGGLLLVYLEPFHSARPEVDSSVTHQAEFHDKRGPVWQFPLEAVFLDETGERRETVPVELNDSNAALAELPEWFDAERHSVKIQPDPDFSAFYRVRYSDALLHNLRGPIERKQLSPMDRLQILNDARALAKSQLIKGDTFRELFDALAKEDSSPVVLEMLAAAQTLSQLKVADATPSPSLEVFTRIYHEHGFEVTGKETLLERRVRSAVLKALVASPQSVGVQVTDEALKTFNRGNVAVFLREPVYLAVVRSGYRSQLKELLRKMAKTDSYEERLRLASALALSSDKDVLKELIGFLNERSGFKSAALQTLVKSSPLLTIKHNLVALKDENMIES